MLAVTSWQLLFGGVALLVVALAVEGPPPPLDGAEVAGFGFVALIATAVAFGCWFSGLARLPAATVGTIGLLNPVTGALVGTLAAGETLNALQIAGIGLVLLGILIGQAVRPCAPTTGPHLGIGASPDSRNKAFGSSRVLAVSGDVAHEHRCLRR